MPTKNSDPHPKDQQLYEDLRSKGDSKQKAARISNAAAAQGRSRIAQKGGRGRSYEDRPVGELKGRAKALGLKGYSKMRKEQLIGLLRNHA